MSSQPQVPAPSKKDEKPQLAGVNVKTRKRNVAVPHDPAGFADKVLILFHEHCDGLDDIEKKLSAAGKALESADLDFSRYGDTLFEIYFAGARMGIGAKLADDGKEKKIEWNMLACAPEKDAILPYVKAFHSLVRRRPFLVQRLEAVLTKLLTSLEFFENDGRKTIAITTALVFTEKLGVLPDKIFEALFNDRLIAKGTVLSVLTDIFRYYMAFMDEKNKEKKGASGSDELVSLLVRAKVANRLLDYFPPGQQTEEAFVRHFEAEGMSSLVEWQSKRAQQQSVDTLRAMLGQLFAEEAGVDAYMECVAEHSEKCPPEEIVRVLWAVMVNSLNMVGKNQMQLLQMIVRSLKNNKKLLEKYANSAKLELALLNCVQVTCYEDNKLLKVFVEVVKALYELEIVGEDTIMFWYKKGSVHRGRNVFVNDIQPFIKWLEEAEEDEDDEDEDQDYIQVAAAGFCTQLYLCLWQLSQCRANLFRHCSIYCFAMVYVQELRLVQVSSGIHLALIY
eukprot:TRINITY_DN13199_c0_g2_i2.p1 TRINITY_DN13199_c0_g2~~TRINITY_DN13199_c0_g2_i2.p1  ORF type:complete len:506 (-),score=54.46 TRINITY_DN13199_c0_g2_i2:193-1710(-)